MKTSSASQIKNAVFSKICSSLKLTAVLSGLVLPFATSAAQTTWTGAVDNNWHEAGNWNNGIPTASSNATFNMTGSTSVSLVGASGNTARLVMENGTVNLDLSSNTLTGTNLIFLTGNGDTLSVKDGTMTGFTGLTAGVGTTDDDNTMNLDNVTLNVGSGGHYYRASGFRQFFQRHQWCHRFNDRLHTYGISRFFRHQQHYHPERHI